MLTDLKITDSDGDTFTVRAVDGAAELNMSVGSWHGEIELTEPDAARMVVWLCERFEFDQVLERADGNDSVTISVPGAAGGAIRTVFWEGSGTAPECRTSPRSRSVRAAGARRRTRTGSASSGA